MRYWINVLVLFIAVLVNVDGQIPAFGRCSNKYKPMKDFNKNKFLGKWYEVEKFYLMRDLVTKCVAVNYDKFEDGKIYVNHIYTNRLTNRRETFSGKFKLMMGENRGIFNVRYDRFPGILLPTFINGLVNYNLTLTVLHSDYENFAIMWTCRNLNQYGHIESSWLMTRDQEPSEEILQTAYGFLDLFGLRNFFIKSDQANCDP